MTKATQSQRGSALPLILGIVLLAGAGVAGWMYFKKQNPEGAAAIEQAAEEPSKIPQQIEASENAASLVDDPTVPAPDTNAAAPPAMPGDAGSATAPVVTEAAAPGQIDLQAAMAPRTVGQANAPIKIIEYASLTCSHCAHFQNDVYPELKTKYIDTGKVFFEFREFPLNDPALKASIAARCLPVDKYEGFVSLLFKTQDHWAGGIDYMPALKQNAKLAGMSDETFEACQNSPELKNFMAEQMKTAQDKWKLSSTPTFVINDGAETISGAVPLEEFERVFRKVSGDAVGAPAAVQ